MHDPRDPRSFHQILHVLLNSSDLNWDEDNCRESIAWARTNGSVLKRVLRSEEHIVLKAVTTYFDTHKQTPTLAGLREIIWGMMRNSEILEVLEGYEEAEQYLEQTPSSDLGVILDQRKDDHEKYKLAQVMDVARSISMGGQKVKVDGKEVEFVGPADALKYLQMRMQQGILISQRPTPGGDTAKEGGDSLLKRYDQACTGAHGQIEMGFPPLDGSTTIGHGDGNMVKFLGILGFTGHGKSTLLFSMIYNAALQGNRVLLCPRECSIEQAWDRIYYLHAAQMGLDSKLPPMKKFLRPKFADPAFREVYDRVISDFRRRNIRIEVRADRTWAEVEASVNAHIDEPYDILAVDYLSHLQVPTGTKVGMEKAGIVEYFHQAQALSQDYEDGRGLVIITPLQANKAGYSAASAGQWNTKGVYQDATCVEQYTDAPRDMDAVIGVWSGEEYRACGLTKVCSIKYRDEYFEPFFLKMDPHTQQMSYIPTSAALDLVSDYIRANPTDLGDDKPEKKRKSTGSKSYSKPPQCTINNEDF